MQSELRDLEKLFPKRDPDNRDAQDKALEEVAKSQQPSAYKKPDDVQESDRGPSPVFLYFGELASHNIPFQRKNSFFISIKRIHQYFFASWNE